MTRRNQDGRGELAKDASQNAPVAPPSCRSGDPLPITLEACHTPPTAPQGAAIADALRLVAVWAVRAARQSPDNVRGEPGRAHSDLDLGAQGSEECVTPPMATLRGDEQ
ncbi:MAG TPA: hypothetical protein VM221_05355 [Armatimonadota bacterium]|nr:hypothetical protein [Armatimonadota bacterium]